jgi:hypothetical protein
MTIVTLKHSTNNIGDDIQRLALEALLPKVDLRIDRDDMRFAEEFGPDTKLIINGWFAKQTHKVWPARTNARILYIGFHANDESVIPKKPRLPIGCRDLWTYELCRRKHVPAWLSWCATLTLQRKIINERKNILFVDISEKALKFIPDSIIQSAQWVTHNIDPASDRDSEAKKRLDLYAAAQCVVTNRLHAMLPCLAMGTPVVFVPSAFCSYRFNLYRHFAWSLQETPWEKLVPKVSSDLIDGMSISFQKTLTEFLES